MYIYSSTMRSHRHTSPTWSTYPKVAPVNAAAVKCSNTFLAAPRSRRRPSQHTTSNISAHVSCFEFVLLNMCARALPASEELQTKQTNQYKVRNNKCKVRNNKCKVRNHKCKVRNNKCKVRNNKCKVRNKTSSVGYETTRVRKETTSER
jgi:hypothetical protein